MTDPGVKDVEAEVKSARLLPTSAEVIPTPKSTWPYQPATLISLTA